MNGIVEAKSVNSDLIYDLGMHTALDTMYYLDKGFRVVALEANPKLVERGREKLGNFIATGKLNIVQRALWSIDEPEVTFYVNDKKDDWSSVLLGNANRDGTGVQEIRVDTVSLAQLFSQFGLPYYVKCDLEGADEMFVDQLVKDSLRPTYVSTEVTGKHGIKLIAKMFAAGYDRMQIVNQAYNGYTQVPKPPREGVYVEQRFNGHMSGLFGQELPKEKWHGIERIMHDYIEFLNLKDRDESLAHGWLDVHFTQSKHVATGR